MSDVLWQNEYERACEAFAEDPDSPDLLEAFRARLAQLGFDPEEIDNEIEAAKQ